MVDEVNESIRPDFVQFIGDNVQNATEAEFQLFAEVAERLRVPFHVLVGDHDVHGDPQAARFRRLFGETYGASSQGGFRLVRLNTCEHQPLGFSEKQVHWLRREIDQAAECGEKVVIFQHHYPFKVYEQFSGPGIETWRHLVQNSLVTAIFTGHTHYGQIANDGRNVSITTRSIGDPEGGEPGFTLACLQGDDLAVTYRRIGESVPLVLITHPRDLLLATGPEHIVSNDDLVIVRIWGRSPVADIRGRIDEQDWLPLVPASPVEWICSLRPSQLAKGHHTFEAAVIDEEGQRASAMITFLVDASRRYTPVPRAVPEVTATAFC